MNEMCHEKKSIVVEEVSKVYTLYPSPFIKFLDLVGLYPRRLQTSLPSHSALSAVSLEVKKGEKVGIIGRNGSGKTTLLKLISRVVEPSSGKITINGNVQALMQVGVGFHLEFTGRQNIAAALTYLGVNGEAAKKAELDIIDFCELGVYIDQPIKTYSLGMQSRLQFACATAINPEILIVDEILGAGDAYFSVKSSQRMERLTQYGSTLILVSHSMAQVLQFCDRCIWIDGGKIIADGPAKDVVVKYEEFMFELSKKALLASGDINDKNTAPIPDWYLDQILGQMPDKKEKGSSSSWLNDPRLQIVSATISDSMENTEFIFEANEPIRFEIIVEAKTSDKFEFLFVVLIYSDDGKPLTRHVSEKRIMDLANGDQVNGLLEYKNCLLGTGSYHASVGVYKNLSGYNRVKPEWYHILNRSIDFKIVSRTGYDPSLFHHPASWNIGGKNDHLSKLFK